MNEEWRKIPGYPLHEASNLGRVRSIARWVHRRHTKAMWRPERILKPQPLHHADDKKPAAVMTRLSPLGDGKNKTVYIHHLILLAFVGPRPLGLECCHNDGDPTNNRIDNLRWDTQRSNLEDKRKHGTLRGPKHLVGEKSPRSKLKNIHIREILASGHIPANHFAEKFGVTRSAIYEVKRRYRTRPDKLLRMGISL